MSKSSDLDDKEYRKLRRRIKAILEADVLQMDELDIYGQILSKTDTSIKEHLRSKRQQAATRDSATLHP